MKKSTLCFAIFSILCLLGSLAAVFVFAWQRGVAAMFLALLGTVLSFVISPSVHEWGHIVAAKKQKMRLVYTKFFCFQIAEREGKLCLSFASPFAPEQTQTLPVCGGNMEKRAISYTRGGLRFGGVSFLLFVVIAVCLQCFRLSVSFFFFALLPYTGYLFLLNAVPVYFAGGKTDALVLKGLKRGADEEKAMLAAMEIFGELSENKSFTEIDEKLFFDLPIIAESLPVSATITDLRYRYCLEKGNMDGAAEQINRLASLTAYMDEGNMEEVAAELMYMHAVCGDTERAKESKKLCENYLQKPLLSAKRILAAYARLLGEDEEEKKARAEFERLKATEKIEGKRKAEEILIER